jgi:ferric iron reductase protein FhuF
MFERLALHRAQGTLQNSASGAVYDRPGFSMERDTQQDALLKVLRDTLREQAAPVVEALRLWSHFPPRATWGMISSSWGAQCSNVFARVGDQCSGAELARALFGGTDVLAQTQPRFYPVTYNSVTRMYYRSSSCCRYYLLPNKQYCAQCPLLEEDHRLRRNVEWLKKSL